MIGILFYQLPISILNSELTGNELSILASIEKITKYYLEKNLEKLSKEQLVMEIKNKINNNEIIIAWNIVLHLQKTYE